MGYPLAGVPPPGWAWLGSPPRLDLAGVPPSPPGVDRQMDRHMSKHNLAVVLRTRSVKSYFYRIFLLQDFVISIIFTILWLIASSAWAQGNVIMYLVVIRHFRSKSFTNVQMGACKNIFKLALTNHRFLCFESSDRSVFMEIILILNSVITLYCKDHPCV